MQPTGLIRTALKQGLAGAAHYSGFRRASALIHRLRCGGRRVLILGYHRVVADLEPELRRCAPAGLISARAFQFQLEAVARAGFEFASMSDAVEVLSRTRTVKKDLCVVTFDDGYRDVYRYAFPLLRARGIPAIFYLPAALIGTGRRLDHDRFFHLTQLAARARFQPRMDELPPQVASVLRLATGGEGIDGSRANNHPGGGPLHANRWEGVLDDCIGECRSDDLRAAIDSLADQLGVVAEPEWGDLIDWNEARRMAAAGYELGAHTLEHVVLTLEGPMRIEREVRGSKELIERAIGAPVRHFSYCNGWYSDQLIRCVSRAGFASAVTTEDFPNRLGESPFTLKRKMLWENFSTGVLGGYSSALTSCSVDGFFGMLHLSHPVPGKRPQRVALQWELSDKKRTDPSGATSGTLPSALEGDAG